MRQLLKVTDYGKKKLIMGPISILLSPFEKMEHPNYHNSQFQTLSFKVSCMALMPKLANEVVKSRHLILALNAWLAQATACPVATQFPEHRCTDDLTTEHVYSIDSQVTWVMDVLSLFV